MSFGFAIGDFIAVGQLAWTLYRECYQIARGAPQEFSLLVSELSTLSSSISILQEEAKDPKSTLTRAGDDRIRMVNEMVAGIEETLKRLRKVASKYEILGSDSKTKRIWAKFKWSADFSSIDRLRNKLIYHNTVMNLLLTSSGNSSLQRIESSNAALESDVQAIKSYITSNQANVGSKAPALSAVDDDLMSTSLSASLMTNAEASQPWSTIGLDQWVGAGRWWLLRAQLDLRTITKSEQSVAPAIYADLIKAAWILVDVIPCHPQYSLIPASKSSELQLLSAEVKNEFSRITALAMVVPALDGLRNQDLRLWESISVKAPLIRPYKDSQNLDAWRVDGGEHVLFRGFAFRELASGTTSACILLLLVHESAKAARLIAQDQYGDITKAISFPELSIKIDVWDRSEESESVIVGKEKFVLSDVQDVQVLRTMIEATTFYVLGRQVDHVSLEDLKAYMLLTAVKNQHEHAVGQIRQESPERKKIAKSNQKESLARLADSMASQWLEGRLFQTDRDDFDYRNCWNRRTSLFIWAVTCNYTELTEFMLRENPVIDRTFNHLLLLSAKYGNEASVRWSLSSTSANVKHVTKSLYIAMENRHENLVALLVNAGADFTDTPDRSLRTFTHEVLRSGLSELLIHAILAFAYASEPESESNLREAADRGHEGAIFLLSYAETSRWLNEPDSSVYSSHLTDNSGKFEQVVAALARVPNVVPAFGLTLMTVERRRTQVLLKMRRTIRRINVSIYLDSYHAYIEDVRGGLSESYKKAVKIGTSGEFSFTVVHQEESLKFTLVNNVQELFEDVGVFPRFDPFLSFEVGSHIETLRFTTTDECQQQQQVTIAFRRSIVSPTNGAVQTLHPFLKEDKTTTSLSSKLSYTAEYTLTALHLASSFKRRPKSNGNDRVRPQDSILFGNTGSLG